MKTPLTILAAAGLAISAAPALAGEVSVKYDDLNLSTEAGKKTLDKRIAAAARKVCQAEMPTTGTRIRSSAARDCVNEVTQSVKQQIAAVVEQRQLGG